MNKGVASATHNAQTPETERRERRLADFYAGDLQQHLKLRAKPYRNVGLWKDNTNDHDEASRRLVQQVTQLAETGSDQKVLEVGCGLGQGAIDLYQSTGCRIVGIDLTREHIDFATRLAHDFGAEEHVQFLQMSATNLCLEAEQFDRVIAVDCAYAFVTRAEFFRQVFRVVKRGGFLVLSDAVIPHPRARGARAAIYRYLLRKWDIPPDNMGNADDYAAELERAGFVRVEKTEISSYVYGPAAAFLNSRTYQKQYRRVHGLKSALLMGFVFRQMAYACERGDLNYYLFKAAKG